MAVRVKVVCSYKQVDSQGNTNLSFNCVYTGSEENKQFFAATPGGTFQFYTVNKNAGAGFEMGKEYYFDIFAAEPPQFQTQTKESSNG